MSRSGAGSASPSACINTEPLGPPSTRIVFPSGVSIRMASPCPTSSTVTRSRSLSCESAPHQTTTAAPRHSNCRNGCPTNTHPFHGYLVRIAWPPTQQPTEHDGHQPIHRHRVRDTVARDRNRRQRQARSDVSQRHEQEHRHVTELAHLRTQPHIRPPQPLPSAPTRPAPSRTAAPPGDSPVSRPAIASRSR